MKVNNKFNMSLDARSSNESFARACVSAFATQLDPTIEEISDIKTAVSEAVTNCIVHAYKETVGKIYISGELCENNIIRIKIRDKGCGIDNIEKAIITSGGVDLKEVSPKTFESKLVSDLYFIGEILDVDAVTGGFNMQIAFSTGYSCGKSI